MNAATDVMPAEFVRWLDGSEPLDELVNDLKALTWQTLREHAVVVLRLNRRALIQGGRVGIQFRMKEDASVDPFGKPATIRSLWIGVEARNVELIGSNFTRIPM